MSAGRPRLVLGSTTRPVADYRLESGGRRAVQLSRLKAKDCPAPR